MESKNFDQDCVKLSENFETSENGCITKQVQQNHVQSSNFTHILKNSTKSVDLSNISKPNKKNKKHHKNNLVNNVNVNVNENENENNIQLKEFHILERLNQYDHTHKPTTFVLIGKRGVGKTHLIKEIILKLKNSNIVDNVMIYSYQTSRIEYIPILQPNQINKITDKIDGEDIEKILENQSKPDAKPLLLVLDDVIYDNSMLNKSKPFQKMLMNSRLYKIYIVLSMQYPLGIPPEIRTNFDFVFVFQDDFISNRKRIYDYYFGIIPQYKIFDKIMGEVCRDYGILTINNFSHSSNFEEKINWYKAKPINLEQNKLVELMELDNVNNNNIDKKDKKVKTNKSKFILGEFEKTDDIDFGVFGNANIEINISNDKIDKNLAFSDDNIDLSNSLEIIQTKNKDKNTIIEKIKKNNKLIKKITKQNEKLYELL
jgi:hypothetical protein